MSDFGQAPFDDADFEAEDDRARDDDGALMKSVPDAVLMVIAGAQYSRRVLESIPSTSTELKDRFRDARNEANKAAAGEL